MAGKTLKETKEAEKKKTRNSSNAIEEENIYKIDTNDSIRKLEEDDDEIDDIFGNVNKWLKDAENEVIEKKTRRKLAKIEEGIKSSKTTKTAKSKNSKKQLEVSDEPEEISDDIEETNMMKAIDNVENDDEPVRVVPTKRTRKTTKTKKTEKKTTKKATSKKITEKEKETEKETEIKIESNQEKPKVTNEIEDVENKWQPSEIKIHTENNLTEIVLKENSYKIELQKTEYNIYTNQNETSYLIVREPILKIITKEGYILLEKHGEVYEITTNQDFKINYVIDNLERRNSEVNFKLTNLTEIFAYKDGLVFEIDEEKVIENNLEDNNTLVISEEDGKVYLPYSKDEIKNEVLQNKGTKISEVIEDKYVLPLDKYKNSMRARFREGYNLMYRKEGKSKRSAIMLGIELMFETNLHPAIISACKNLEELDIYLDCLEDNELEKFSCFKIIYKSLPTLRKKAKFQEY